MAITYGFYNSIDHDRKYDATHFSKIFDGIIRDGVFATIDDALTVTSDSGMTIFVNKGKAWFNHTWTLNDAILPLTLDDSDLVLPRIDAVVLEVNQNLNVRANTIKIVKGTASTNAQRPVMEHTEYIDQYPLAYISIPANATEITQANITNMIGTEETPFVTGILQTINASSLYAQWQAEFEEQMITDEAEFRSWYRGKQNEISDWFDTFIDELTEDQAINLQNQINTINVSIENALMRLNTLETRTPIMSYGTNEPSTSTAGYGIAGSLYFKIIT